MQVSGHLCEAVVLKGEAQTGPSSRTWELWDQKRKLGEGGSAVF